MPSGKPFSESLADWKRQASDLSHENWPSRRIKAHLIQQGCPERIAKKLASASSKGRGLTLIFAGIALLIGWVLLGVIQQSTDTRFGIIGIALFLAGIGALIYGIYQVVFD